MSSYTDFARVYDALTANIDYVGRAAYYHRMIKQFGGKKGILLDLACGTGSMSVEFARMGYDVIGVDASEEMLSAAMEKKFDSGLDSIIYLCQPMEGLDLYGTVDVTVCALDSLNHITEPEALQQALNRVSLFTNPGGLFLFDVNTIYKHEQVLADNIFLYDEPEVYCVWQNTSETNHMVCIDLDLFIPDGDIYRRSVEQFSERAYAHEELCAMLERAGLKLLAVYDEDSANPPRADSERLIYITQKS